MPNDAAILTLTQWFSPAFPVGAFSYSHGLERAIGAGDVADRDSLSDWIEGVLEHGAGRADATFLAAAYQSPGPEAVADTDKMCRAFAASRERLLETDRQGAAFCRTIRAVWGCDLPDLAYPVAAGRAARLIGLPQDLTAACYLHAFVANLVSVGVRLIPVGQTGGQQVIRELTPLCPGIARETAHGNTERLGATAFLADIAAMRHETQYSRIFRT